MKDTLIGFILCFLLAEAILAVLHFLLRKRKLGIGARIAVIVAKLLAAIICAFLPLAGPVQLRAVQPFLMAAYVALLADAIVDLCISLILRITKKERKLSVVRALSLLCGALLLAYGIVNMQTVKPKYHSYESEKLAAEHTFVFFADLHVGSAQSFETTEKTVEKIKAEKPDFVIMGGDIVDDYTTKEEMENTFALFKDFDVPVYYLYGNHDRQGHAEYAGGVKFTQSDLEAEMKKNNVIILKDEFAEISSDLILLGREDVSEGEGRADASSLVNPNPGAYLVVADHQSVEFKENLKIGTDLQLSGHTHAGQLFPLKWLYALIGGYVYGDYREGDAVMNVSSGACGWRVPLRTDAHCNYEVITLKPSSREN